jgi:uracil-DNA glycosylase family protein
MLRRHTAAQYLPDQLNLSSLRHAAEACEGCELYKQATQTVFGSGRRSAAMMLVGEMPGDQEDKEGEPFVGPAGWLLDAALEEAGIDRSEVYLTNVVKHFRWEGQGSKRIHKKPSARHITACKPWLEAELEVIRPNVIVCLGATAAQFFFGKDFRITLERGQALETSDGTSLVATYHPSAVLRAPGKAERDRMKQALIDDLHLAHSLVPLKAGGN